jgi:RNA polymerase sigma-70 factor (ECF subfamily)
VADGDENSFAQLYIFYYRKLRHFLLKMNRGQEELVGDILQETFFRIWINRDKLVEIENFEAWLYKVVANESLSILRKELHAKTKADRFKEHSETQNNNVYFSKHIEIDEIKKIVNEAIESMPPQRKQIYQLSREQGMTPAQIAGELGISLPTVYNTLTSALKHIRQHLTSAGYGTYLYIIIILRFF